jgi:NADH-quinone oxidoreductase subunit N
MTLSDLMQNINVVLPLAALVAWSCVLLFIDLFIPQGRKGWTALLAALGLVLSLVLTIARYGHPAAGFGGMVIEDGFSLFLNILFLSSGLVAIALAFDYIKRL